MAVNIGVAARSWFEQKIISPKARGVLVFFSPAPVPLQKTVLTREQLRAKESESRDQQ